MNYFLFKIALNYTVLIPAVIGMIRFKKMLPDFYPFVFLIWLGWLNETLNIAMIYTYQSNTINSNLYVILEYGLILLQFYKWNGTSVNKYRVFAILGLAVWFTDNAIIHSITENNSLFRVFLSFVVVFLSIDQINKILVFEKGMLLKNAVFIICIGFLFYFGCKAFVESFNILRFGLSNLFLGNLWTILYFVNAFTNALFALAMLWIPGKQKFILRY